MVRPITRTQYVNAKQKVASILAEYGSVEDLEAQHIRFRSTNDPALRLFSAVFRKYTRNHKKVLQYEREQLETRPLQCNNCKRVQSQHLVDIHGEHSPYTIVFQTHSTLAIRRQRPFKTVKGTSNEDNACDVLLCTPCAHHIVIEEKKQSACKVQYSWPGFIYYLLKNKSVKQEYGEQIWRFIPTEWRYWWIDVMKNEYPASTSLSIETPSPIFRDITSDMLEWDAAIQSYDLQRLADCLDKFLLPTTLCPFGCSEYQHRLGRVPLDITFQRYLPRCLIDLIHDTAEFKYLIPARDDFVRLEDEYDLLLLNPLWKVKPAISFDKCMAPAVMTCREHNEGESRFIVHTCRQPNHILPAPMSDQVSHCVVQSRLIKPLKPSTYSTEFQMHEQRGTFCGIDTFSVTEFGRFDTCSVLLSENESRSISNRPDLNALLSHLVKSKSMSRFCANARRTEAADISRGVNFEPFYRSATYVPVHIAISFHREQNEKEISAIHGDDVACFNRMWPLYPFPCQKGCAYGARFPASPPFKSRTSDTRALWSLCSIMSRVEVLWNIVATAELNSADWNGWVLVFLSRQCFKEIQRRSRQDKRDPFKHAAVAKEELLADKVNIQSLEQAFANIPHVLYFSDLRSLEDLNAMRAISVSDKVIIAHLHYTIDDEVPELLLDIVSGNLVYKLQYLSRQWSLVGDAWDAEVFCRHGKQFSEWWYQQRFDKLATHSSGTFPNLLEQDDSYILVYVREDKEDLNSLGSEFLTYIGGQAHIRCQKHKMPLVVSTERKFKCQCGRNEFYRCCSFECNVCICQRCCSRAHSGGGVSITYIGGNDSHEDPNNEDTVASGGTTSDDESMEDTETHSSATHDDYHSSDVENVCNADDIILENDNFNDFVTSNPDPDVPALCDDDSDNGYLFDPIPTTNAGELPLEFAAETRTKGMTISGHVLTNQCGTCLTRQLYQIKGSSKHKYFLQRICASTIGSSIPLLYPEATIFPSIHWKMADTAGSIFGAIPSSLLTENVKKFGFAATSDVIRGRLKSPSSATSTNPNYIAFMFDIISNICANHSDTRIVIRKGLTASTESSTGLGVRSPADSSLLGSIDSKQAVRNLCASQKYHPMDYFVTFTCNQKKHFGVSSIRRWIDSDLWMQEFKNFDLMEDHEKKEIKKAIHQASAPLILQNWQETSQLFLDFLRKSPRSPFLKVLSLFARMEYQKEAGNVSHTHAIIQISRKDLSEDEQIFINDLIRASILDVIRSDEVNKLVEDGILKDKEEVQYVLADARSFLAHKCDHRCLINLGNGKFHCRKLNIFSSTDNTKHVMKPLPNNFSLQCIQVLIEIGMVRPLCVNVDGHQSPFQSSHPFFHPVRHIPPTNPSDPLNMSPCEGITFAVCRSMQNVQLLTECGGVNTYVCKYIGKIDENNYIVACIDRSKNNVGIISKAEFYHNSKITTSKINDDKDKAKRGDDRRPSGRAVSEMEMLHHMLCYPEIITDLAFVQCDTVTCDLRRAAKGVSITPRKPNDEWSDNFQLRSHLDPWRHHSEHDTQLLYDLSTSRIKVDSISLFSLRPPELRDVFNSTGDYFRWFSYSHSKVKERDIIQLLDPCLEHSSWIDALFYAIKLRRLALAEVERYLDTIHPESPPHVLQVCALFRRIIYVTSAEHHVLDDDDTAFLHFVETNLLDNDVNLSHLPVPVFSYIKPTLGVQFLLHLLLSLGRFSNEIDLCLQPSFREAFRVAKLIGPSDEINELQKYSDALLRRFIEDQLVFFPKSKRVIDRWILSARELLNGVIVDNDIPISDLPACQFTALYADDDLNSPESQFIVNMRTTVAEAALKELNSSIALCGIPSLEDILSATRENPLEWDPTASYNCGPNQVLSSFNEQRFAISMCQSAIMKYTDVFRNNSFVKSIGIRGFPGSGKTWTMLYLCLYALSQGLNVSTTAMMARRAVQLGGKHWHYIFNLPFESSGQSPQQMAEFAMSKIVNNSIKLNVLKTLDVLMSDEMGQVPSDLLAVIDIILRRIRSNDTFLGGLLIICTMDHTQLQPVTGRPFLTSIHIIPCFRMIELKTSVRASDDAPFQRLQAICRFSHRELEENPNLVQEFLSLCSENLTFVPNWSDPAITANTYRLYSKRVPAKDAARDFVQRIQRLIPPDSLRQCNADDIEKNRYSHSDWVPASRDVKNTLNTKLREPELLLFFRGAIYEFTFNQEGFFSQAQSAILFDLPSQDDLNNNKKINVLCAPPGMKDVEFDPLASKQSYVDKGFKEVKVGIAPERSYSVKSNIQAQRKQYGLKHRVTATIHAAMGDTLIRMATEVSRTDPNFSVWDKGQLVVVLSRTKYAKDSIFVGDKQETLAVFEEILLRKTQWSDYIERVLDVVTLTPNEGDDANTTFTQQSYPFRICDIILPQCRTGYVYMLISLKNPDHTFFGQTNCLRQRIQSHNSGYGANGMNCAHLRPFALMAFICGFNGQKNLRDYICIKWLEKKCDLVVSDGITDPHQWALCGQTVLNELDTQRFGVDDNELKLVCLFRPSED